MAAAFFNALADPERALAVSAGTQPADRVHPEVVTVMREAGIDLAGATPRHLTEDLAAGGRLLVTMGCGETCPVIPGLRRDDWPIEDPKGRPLEGVRAIRDEIRDRVQRLIAAEGWGPAGTAVTPRRAAPADALAIARIYNQGIEDRIATFETRLRAAKDVVQWFDGIHPIVVGEVAGRVVAFASTFGYRPRQCYAAIAEFSVYVERAFRGRGVGGLVLRALIAEACTAGLHKLVSRIFPENHASRNLCKSLGFREVGIYHEHGQLEGVWKDCVIVERTVAAER